MMKKKSDDSNQLLGRRREEKQLDDLLRITKDTNAMLRGERNMRKIKTLLVLVVLLSSTGYGYYLFEKHKLAILEFQGRVEELQGHLQEMAAVIDQVGDTAGSIRSIFDGSDN